MKNLKYLLFIYLFLINVSFSKDLNNYIKIGKDNKISLNDVSKFSQDDIMKKLDQEIQKLQNKLDKNITDITKKFDDEINKSTERINNNIIGKAEKLVDDAKIEYNNAIKIKNSAMGSVENIIKNIPTYIFIAKLIISIVVISLLLMIFLFWRAYKKTKNLASSILNMSGLDTINSINTRLTNLENKIDQLLSK